MTSTQKVIKALAIILAIYIILNIFTAIITGTFFFGKAMGAFVYDSENDNKSHNLKTVVKEYNEEEIESLDIKIDAGKFEIVEADNFKVELKDVSTDVECRLDGKTLVIDERNHRNNIDNNTNIKIYCKKATKFKKIDIKLGATSADLNDFEVEEFNCQMGAGEVDIDNVIVSRNSSIRGGLGEVTIKNSDMKNFDLTGGVGEIVYNGKLSGDSKITCGVGEIRIDLVDAAENYSGKAKKGIGSCTVDGKNIGNDETFGDGENYIDVTGGVGSVDIDFNK